MRGERLYVNDRGDCVMLASGFSWLAGIAIPVWALQRRLYAFAVFMMVVGAAINLVAGPQLQAALFVSQFLLYGAFANRAHRALLERRGWRVTAEERTPPRTGV